MTTSGRARLLPSQVVGSAGASPSRKSVQAPQSASADVPRAMDFAAAQAERILRKYPGYAPMYTVGGKWNREGEPWTHWCEGFFPGILWLLHRHTGDGEMGRRCPRSSPGRWSRGSTTAPSTTSASCSSRPTCAGIT